MVSQETAEYVGCYDAKVSIATWWVLIIIAVMLWYRGIGVDRVMAPFIVVLALVQLMIYGLQSGANPRSGGQIISFLLWFSLVVLAISVYIYTKSPYAAVLVGISSIFLIAVMAYGWESNSDALSAATHFTTFGWVFVIGLISLLVLLLMYQKSMNVGICLLLALVVVGAVAIYSAGGPLCGATTAFSVIFAFTAWAIGYL